MESRARKLLHGGLLPPLLVFLAAFLLYALTAEPGASWWDCPEYLLSAILLEIGHPPGNPFWSLTHRFLSSFSTDPMVQVRIINTASGFFMAAAAALLCSVSLTTLRLLFSPPSASTGKRGASNSSGVSLPAAAVAVAGSLCFAFCDSAWFSAVEAEVYAMSTFLTALCVRVGLSAALTSDSAQRYRLILLIAYICGLSIGVHLLNLLVIPFLVPLLDLSRTGTNGRKSRVFMRGCAGFLVGCAAVALILLGLIPGWLRLAGLFELFCVNRLGLPLNSGTLAAAILSLLVFATIPFLVSPTHSRVRTLLWSAPMILTGYFAYGLIIIRAESNPPMNQGDPSDPFRLYSYIQREQYEQSSLLFGPSPWSRPVFREEWRDSVPAYLQPVRIPDRVRRERRNRASLSSEVRYFAAGSHSHVLMTPELEQFFPRIHDRNGKEFYRDWAGADTASMQTLYVRDAMNADGELVPRRDRNGIPRLRQAWKPTLLQNLRFFAAYQCGYMYARYLLWNFSGRQNDRASGGEIDRGNFLTGLPALDDMMLGPQELLPQELGRGNAGRNRYFMIPFLFGIAGIVFLCLKGGTRRRKILFCSLILFLMTGPAIVLYLNQGAGEPRERDYSFIGSFWVFAFWISVGMGWLVALGRGARMRTGLATVIFAVPAWMLRENLDDHDRGGRHFVEYYAGATLNALPENAILFVEGDNDTFPFWYAQHLLGVRPDVTVVNLSYLSAPWYIESLRRTTPFSRGLALTLPPHRADDEALRLCRIETGRDSVYPLPEALRILYADRSPQPSLPAGLLQFGKEGFLMDLRPEKTGAASPVLTLRRLMVIDIVSTNASVADRRPVVWHPSVRWKDYAGFFDHTVRGPFGRYLAPESGADYCQPDSVVRQRLMEFLRGKAGWLGNYESFGNYGNYGIEAASYIDEISEQKLTAVRRELLLMALHSDSETRGRIMDYLRERLPVELLPCRTVELADSTVADSELFELLLSEKEARSLREIEERRHREREAYRRSLPPSRRHAIGAPY